MIGKDIIYISSNEQLNELMSNNKSLILYFWFKVLQCM